MDHFWKSDHRRGELSVYFILLRVGWVGGDESWGEYEDKKLFNGYVIFVFLETSYCISRVYTVDEL